MRGPASHTAEAKAEIDKRMTLRHGQWRALCSDECWHALCPCAWAEACPLLAAPPRVACGVSCEAVRGCWAALSNRW